MNKRKKCPLCDSTKTERFEKVSNIFRKRITYLHCKNCDFIYAPETKKYDLSKLYNEDYFKRTDFGWKTRTDWVLKYLYILNKAINLKKLKICDFGAGNGYLTKKLMNDGFDVAAYEPYRQKKSFIKKKEYKTKPYKTDVLLMIEVFEHFTDAINELNNIFAKFQDPLLVILTTNISDYACGSINEWDYLNPDAGHFTLWSKKSLNLFGKTHNYQCISLTDTIHIFYKDLKRQEEIKLNALSLILKMRLKLKKIIGRIK